MDKYEFKLKIDEMKALVSARNYNAAAEIAETISWRKIRNLNALVLAGEVFEQVGRYEESKEILLMAYDKSPIGRNIIYRLAEIAIKTQKFDEAKEYYDEFVDIAPHDNLKFVLKYKMTAAQGLPYKEQIKILEELKEQEYSEEWAYELAYLYHKDMQPEKCVEACDELILWFGDGIYVEKALELKLHYQPLSKPQEEKYRMFRQKRTGVIEVRPNDFRQSGETVNEDAGIPPIQTNSGQYTANLQAEIAKGMQQISAVKMQQAGMEQKVANLTGGKHAAQSSRQVQNLAQQKSQAPLMQAYQPQTSPMQAYQPQQEPQTSPMQAYQPQQAPQTPLMQAQAYQSQQEPQAPPMQAYQLQQEPQISPMQAHQPQQERQASPMQAYQPQQERQASPMQAYQPQQERQVSLMQAYQLQQERQVPTMQAYQPQQKPQAPPIQGYQPQQERQVPPMQAYQPQQERQVPPMQVYQEAQAPSMQVYQESPVSPMQTYQPQQEQQPPMQYSAQQEQSAHEMTFEEIQAEWERTKQAMQDALQEARNAEAQEQETEKERSLEKAEQLMQRLLSIIPQLAGGMASQVSAEQGIETEDQQPVQVQNDLEQAGRIVAGMNQILQEQIDSLLAQEEQKQAFDVHSVSDPTRELPHLPEDLTDVKENGAAEKIEMDGSSLERDTFEDNPVMNAYKEAVQPGISAIDLLQRVRMGKNAVNAMQPTQTETEAAHPAQPTQTGMHVAGSMQQPEISVTEYEKQNSAEEVRLDFSAETANGNSILPENIRMRSGRQIRNMDIDSEETGRNPEYPIKQAGIESEDVLKNRNMQPDFQSEHMDSSIEMSSEREYLQENRDDREEYGSDYGDSREEYAPEYRNGREEYAPEYRDGREEYAPEYRNGREEYAPEYRDSRQGYTSDGRDSSEEYASEYIDNRQEEPLEDRNMETHQEYPLENKEMNAEPEYENEQENLFFAARPRFLTQAQLQAESNMDVKKDAQATKEFSKEAMAASRSTGFYENAAQADEQDMDEMKRLTSEQKQIFSYFVPIAGMEAQIYDLISGVSEHLQYDKHALTGNIIIEGISGSGKTVLIMDIIKALQKEIKLPVGKTGKIDANALNQKDLDVLMEKISGGCLIIESAGKISRETAVRLSQCMEKDHTGTLYIIEDTAEGIQKALARDSSFAAKFTEKISIPLFSLDELVEFGKAYANDLNYDIDEMGVLALYKRIGNIQKLDHVTTLTEVKEIVDEAIDNAEKGVLKKVFGILTATRANDDNYVILREKDFEID